MIHETKVAGDSSANNTRTVPADLAVSNGSPSPTAVAPTSPPGATEHSAGTPDPASSTLPQGVTDRITGSSDPTSVRTSAVGNATTLATAGGTGHTLSDPVGASPRDWNAIDQRGTNAAGSGIGVPAAGAPVVSSPDLTGPARDRSAPAVPASASTVSRTLGGDNSGRGMGSASAASDATVPRVQPAIIDPAAPTLLNQGLLINDPTSLGINVGLLNPPVRSLRPTQEVSLPGHTSTDGAPPTASGAPHPLGGTAGITWPALATDSPASVGAALQTLLSLDTPSIPPAVPPTTGADFPLTVIQAVDQVGMQTGGSPRNWTVITSPLPSAIPESSALVLLGVATAVRLVSRRVGPSSCLPRGARSAHHGRWPISS
jgi:hypothetical protein